jgi:hypothetical protein
MGNVRRNRMATLKQPQHNVQENPQPHITPKRPPLKSQTQVEVRMEIQSQHSDERKTNITREASYNAKNLLPRTRKRVQIAQALRAGVAVGLTC